MAGKKQKNKILPKGSFKMLLEIKNMAEMKTEDEGHFLNSRAEDVELENGEKGKTTR